MAQDNRLVCEFQEAGTIRFDVGVAGGGGTGFTTSSGLYGGVMPYRQAADGSLSDGLATTSGLAGNAGEPFSVNRKPVERMALFQNEVHILANGYWHRQNETTGDWELVCHLDTYETYDAHTGLHAAYNQETGEHLLFCLFRNSAATPTYVPVVYSSLTQAATTGTAYAYSTLTANASPCGEVMHRNNLYFSPFAINGSYVVYNPISDVQNLVTFSPTNLSTNVYNPFTFCSYNGDVYILCRDRNADNSGILSIYNATTPSPGLVMRVPFDGEERVPPHRVSTAEFSQRLAFFPDNNPVTSSGQINGLGDPDAASMWLITLIDPNKAPSTGGSANICGWGVWQMQGTGNNISVVQEYHELMGPYRVGLLESISSAWNEYDNLISYCDNYPGWFTTNPEKGFLTARPWGGEPGQTFRQWDFDPHGGGTPTGGADIGGPAKVSMSQDQRGGGLRWSPAATSTVTGQDVNIFDIVYQSGHFVSGISHYRLYYKLMPSTAYHAGTQVNVRWYHDRWNAPKTRCVLAGTSHGTLNGDQVDDITMLSGVNYYVDWDITGVKLDNASGVYLCGLAFTDAADIGDL